MPSQKDFNVAGDSVFEDFTFANYSQSIGLQMAAKNEKLLEEQICFHGLKITPRMKKFQRHILPNGIEIYKHNGNPILELRPMRFETVRDGDSYKMVAHQSYRTFPRNPQDVA